MARILRNVSMFLLLAVVLTACFGRPSPINVKSVKTVINEDGSGSNTFRFAKPVSCEMLDFRPALEDYRTQYGGAGGDVLVSKFNDGTDAGWDVTVKFDYPEQIPAQIEGLKRSIVLTLEKNWTGPYEPSNWDAFSATNDNEFSVKVDYPATTRQGKEWDVSITISPALLATPEADCSYPEIRYEIVMPGEVKSYTVSVVAYSGIFENIFPMTTGTTLDEQLVKYAVAQKVKGNTLLWVIKPKSIAEIMLENDGVDVEKLLKESAAEDSQVQLGQMVYDHLMAHSDERAGTGRLFGTSVEDADTASLLFTVKPIYSIHVQSATPMTFAQFVLSNITPIVVVIGGILGAIYTILNIRQAILKRKEKAGN